MSFTNRIIPAFWIIIAMGIFHRNEDVTGGYILLSFAAVLIVISALFDDRDARARIRKGGK